MLNALYDVFVCAFVSMKICVNFNRMPWLQVGGGWQPDLITIHLRLVLKEVCYEMKTFYFIASSSTNIVFGSLIRWQYFWGHFCLLLLVVVGCVCFNKVKWGLVLIKFILHFIKLGLGLWQKDFGSRFCMPSTYIYIYLRVVSSIMLVNVGIWFTVYPYVCLPYLVV